MKVIDIVLPVLNEEAGIVAFNEGLFAVLARMRDRYAFHVIYVVDRSRDNTFEVLCRLSEQHQELTALHPLAPL